jgi:Terminase large subunit, T4likevirus-type, N-terminal
MAAGAVIELDATDRIPTPSQQRFLDSRARIAAFVAGYGAGKTSTGAEKALDLIAANPGCNGMIVAPTYGQLEKAALRAFFDHEAPDDGACPKEWIAEVNIGKRYFLHPNGARTYWGSADSPRSLEGQNLAWFWLDEPGDCRLRSYQVLVGRLRDKRAKRVQGFVTGTPRPGWMWGEFNSGKAEQEIVHGSTRENAAHLAPGTIETLERTYSAREARVLIDGEFGLLVGAVYDDFDRKTHLVEWKYDPRFRTVCFIDFGFRRPYVGWAQQIPAGWKLAGVPVPPGGAWVVFDELVKDNVTVERLAGMIKEKGYNLEVIYCDPAGDATQSSTGLSDIIVLKSTLCFDNVRWVTAPKYRHIPNGVSIVRGMLRNARSEIRLWFAKSLARPNDTRGILKSLEGYAYPEAKDGRPVGDEPLKDGLFDHAGDGLRYFAINLAASSGAPLPDVASL